MVAEDGSKTTDSMAVDGKLGLPDYETSLVRLGYVMLEVLVT